MADSGSSDRPGAVDASGPGAGSGGEFRAETGESQLGSGLSQRHLTMISLGGVIGAGLFVGSGAIMAEVGPAAVLTYLIAGCVVVLVMRMLGEMAVANPQVGSFVEYARRAVGDWAGFSVGWLYWWFWVVVVGVEAVAGAEALRIWMPEVPLWLFCLILMILLTATNLYSVKSFGEFEFWFASIKVAAIIVFIAIGLAFVLGLWPGASADFSNLTAHEGFAPAGLGAAFTGIAIVIFAFIGAEIVTIAAAESDEPEKGVARATNQVVARVLVFYVLSVFLVVTILPWNSAQVGESPFVAALGRVGIPGAATIMNAIVITAVLSCLNSGLYTASRMLFALARRGEAPKGFLDVTRKGVPLKAILTCTVVGFATVIAAAISPEGLFLFLVNTSGAIALFVYLMIAISQLRMRRILEREAPERLTLKMWLFPYLTYLTIGAIIAVLLSMAFIETSTRQQLLLSLLSVAVVLGAYFANSRLGGGAGQRAAARGATG